MLFKTLAALGIALPLIGFGLLVIQPSLNINVAIPLLRYYFVTLAALVGCVISFFVVAALRETRRIRPLLLALMFGWMSLLYVIHGALTVGALIGVPHPAALWSPWIALWGGGALLLAGAWLPNQRDGRLVALLASVGGLALLGFLGLAAVAPQVLDALSGDTGRMAQVSGVLVLWGLALFSHLWHWARKPDGLDGVFVIDSLWGLMAVGALHLFADGQLGWWLHIAVLLLAWLTTMTLLWRTEERVRAFHLTRTYAVASAIVTAALALASGEVYSRIVFGNLVDEVVSGSGAINRGLAANLATHLDLESAPSRSGVGRSTCRPPGRCRSRKLDGRSVGQLRRSWARSTRCKGCGSTPPRHRRRACRRSSASATLASCKPVGVRQPIACWRPAAARPLTRPTITTTPCCTPRWPRPRGPRRVS